MSDDHLTIVVGNNTISGWESIRVTQGVERCPSDFVVSLTENYPSSPGVLNQDVMKPGDACTVFLGSDRVITGYIDKFIPRITPSSHSITVAGRGKCQDLTDCCATYPNSQISNSSVLQIAQAVAKPYGISVSASPVYVDQILQDTQTGQVQIVQSSTPVAEDTGKQIPQLNLDLSENAFDLIERLCRFRGLLAYELPDGNLFLTQVGMTAAASGFEEGKNVQEATFEYSMDECYQQYLAYMTSVDFFADVGIKNLQHIAYDFNVRRFRNKVVIAEAGYGASGLDVCIQRANWESARRAGRARKVKLTTDSWRDADGKLWKPNTLVPLSLPSLKLPGPLTWCISEVSFLRDEENGTTAELVIMPPDSFLPMPQALAPVFADVPQF